MEFSRPNNNEAQNFRGCCHLTFVINLGKLFIFHIQNERATGFGVALLLTLFGAHPQNPVLNTIAPPKLLT